LSLLADAGDNIERGPPVSARHSSVFGNHVACWARAYPHARQTDLAESSSPLVRILDEVEAFICDATANLRSPGCTVPHSSRLS
jgi:hypothetical protein